MATRYENVLDNFGRLRILSLGSNGWSTSSPHQFVHREFLTNSSFSNTGIERRRDRDS